jgi:hypothetical protein
VTQGGSSREMPDRMELCSSLRIVMAGRSGV